MKSGSSPTFEELMLKSENAYSKAMSEIEQTLLERYNCLSPWAWSDPFCQCDPLDDGTLDELVCDIDIVSACDQYFRNLGFDVDRLTKQRPL